MNSCFHIEIIRPNKLRRHIKNLSHLGTCERCEAKEAWICLTCFSQFCYGEQRHIRSHYDNTKHPLCMSLQNSTVCCMTCHLELTPESFPESHRNTVRKLLDNITQALDRRPIELSKPNLSSLTLRNFREVSSPANPQKCESSEHIGTAGLLNLGNTCFMNSVIQSLNCISPLYDYIQDLTVHSKNSLYSSLTRLFQQLRAHSQVAPRDFYSALLKRFPQFRGSEQQDAHEFLKVIIEFMIEETRELISNDKSGIQELFEGSLLSTYICKRCAAVTRNLEPFYDLSIEIPQGNQRSSLSIVSEATEEIECVQIQPEELPENYRDIECYEPKFAPSCSVSHLLGCLEHFFSYEELTDIKNLFECHHCQCRTFASRRFLIMKSPQILVIHLKRFYQKGLKFSKLNSDISFDLNLSLKKFISCPSECGDYSLFSVIEHIGTMNEGHYISYVNHSDSWYKCDDSDLTTLSEEDLKNVQAYMLLYIKDSTY